MAIKFGSNSNTNYSDTVSADFFIGGRGKDTVTGSKGFDQFFTGYGDDTIKVGSGNTGVDGGEGRDTVSVAGGTWLIGTPSFGHAATSLVNTVTGQTVGLSDVEVVKLGSRTVTFQFGTDGNNKLSGGKGDDFIFGRDGKDTIGAGAGNDRISSGNGADTVKAGAGNDIVDDSFAVAGRGLYAPTSNTDAEKNTFDLGAGDDIAILRSDPYASDDFTVYTERESFDINGGSGADAVVLSNFFTPSPWTVEGGSLMIPSLMGGSKAFAKLSDVEQVVDLFNDRVWTKSTGLYERSTVSKTGTALSEKVVGGSGSDVLKGNGGFDYFTGGKGTDTVELSGTSALWNGGFTGSTVQTKNGFTGARLENLFETTATVLNADIEKIKFLGGAGTADDTLYNFKIVKTNALNKAGTAANDFVVVSKGSASDKGVLLAGKGNDHIVGEGSLKSFDGGEGNDIVQWRGASDKATFAGGAGNDQIGVFSFEDTKATVSVNGGSGDDQLSLIGKGAVKGGTGDDLIAVGGGASGYGEDGNDTFAGAVFEGKSTVDGGKGDDVFTGYDVSTNYRITATKAGIVITSKADGGSITLKNIEALKFEDMALDLRPGSKSFASFNGAGSADAKTGGKGIDLMNGGAGADKLNGGAGNDVLAGDAGNDTLSGSSGDDVLDGGAGNDTLTGGAGFDTFLFLNPVTTADNAYGNDKITDFDAGKGLGDVIAFAVDEPSFNSFEDMLSHATQSKAGTLIQLDANHSVLLQGVAKTDLAADDFIFI